MVFRKRGWVMPQPEPDSRVLLLATDTVWAYVLEEQEAVPPSKPAYKLRLKFARYVCRALVDDLARSVGNTLYESGYFRPEKIRIYRNNPFAEEHVENNNDDKIYHLRDSANELNNNVPISDVDREDTHPFYVLVSKLEKRQPAMDIAAATSVAVQGTPRLHHD